jgi:hypothetical protein
VGKALEGAGGLSGPSDVAFFTTEFTEPTETTAANSVISVPSVVFKPLPYAERRGIVPAMIRRWGSFALPVFFLLALLLAAGAWVGSYCEWVSGYHYSARTGRQEVTTVCGCIYLISGDFGWIIEPWYYQNGRVNPTWAAVVKELYGNAPYHFLGFAFDPDEPLVWGGPARARMVMLPLWFPTALSALGLLWAWRRKRRFDRTRRGGFEVQQKEPQV